MLFSLGDSIILISTAISLKQVFLKKFPDFSNSLKIFKISTGILIFTVKKEKYLSFLLSYYFSSYHFSVILLKIYFFCLCCGKEMEVTYLELRQCEDSGK